MRMLHIDARPTAPAFVHQRPNRSVAGSRSVAAGRSERRSTALSRSVLPIRPSVPGGEHPSDQPGPGLIPRSRSDRRRGSQPIVDLATRSPPGQGEQSAARCPEIARALTGWPARWAVAAGRRGSRCELGSVVRVGVDPTTPSRLDVDLGLFCCLPDDGVWRLVSCSLPAPVVRSGRAGPYSSPEV